MTRIGIDTGGTFTDCILWDDETGSFALAKVPSQPASPDSAVRDGIDRLLLESGTPAAAVRYVGHGTTVATNAVITGSFARAGLIATAGTRDVLEIGTQMRPRLYSLTQHEEGAIIPRDRRFEVPGRLAYDGTELEPVNEAAVIAAVAELRAAGVEAVGIAGLFSFLHPRHEDQIAAIVERELPGVYVARSSQVSPELREYPRYATLAVNVTLAPLLNRYIGRLADALAGAGFGGGLYVMQSNGGVTTAARSVGENAHRLVLSGPAAGVLGGCFVAGLAGVRDVVTLDMGGTSADIGVAAGGIPRSWVGLKLENGLPLQISALEVEAIGAGGGSIAWVDDGGALRVGPQSAGAEPGPACYGRGGSLPTVTDAHVVLGRIDPDNFLGGGLRLDGLLARQAVGAIAERLGRSAEDAAAGIIAVTEANMVGAIRRAAARHGDDLRLLSLVPAGGAGPLHGAPLATRLGMANLIVPPNPGLLSALGVLVADLRHDLARPFVSFLDQVDRHEMDGVVSRLASGADGLLASDGVPPEQRRFERALDLRYVGQEWTLSLPIADGESLASIDERYHTTHERLYGHAAPGERIEVTAVRVTGWGVIPRPVRLDAPVRQVPRSASSRPVWFAETGFVATTILDRAALHIGETIVGPAVIEQLDTTTLIPPGWQAIVHPAGSLILERWS